MNRRRIKRRQWRTKKSQRMNDGRKLLRQEGREEQGYQRLWKTEWSTSTSSSDASLSDSAARAQERRLDGLSVQRLALCVNTREAHHDADRKTPNAKLNDPPDAHRRSTLRGDGIVCEVGWQSIFRRGACDVSLGVRGGCHWHIQYCGGAKPFAHGLPGAISCAGHGHCVAGGVLYAMTQLPLATAITLNYTSPIFLTLLSTLALGERPLQANPVCRVTGNGGCGHGIAGPHLQAIRR